MARILIIDDSDPFRKLLREILEREGFDVSEAANGDLGIREFHRMHTDLVITDIVMPEKEGIQTIRELKRDVPGVKIIAISGGGRHTHAPDYLQLALDFGADRAFPKPFDRLELLNTVRNMLGPASSPDPG